MKTLSAILSLAFTGQVLAHALTAPPHLDLEMTSAEYAKHLKTLKKSGQKAVAVDPVIESTIKLGARLSAWIAKVNAARTPETAIRLTSATTRSGIPIDKPSIYNPEIIQQRLAEALSQCPEEMRNILTGSGDLPSTLPVEDADFIKAARPVDKQYQSAARFKSLEQWHQEYADQSKDDVRGYYYLTSNKITEAELADVTTVAADKVEAIKEALTQVCVNSTRQEYSRCKTVINSAWNKNKVAPYYAKYMPSARAIWNAFFAIPSDAVRTDIIWTGATATVPFNTPSIPKFIPYLQVNIEDEFRWEGWGLKMNFGTFRNGPVLIFQPGVVPHVNGLGGNEIVMDSNQPIEEYESQWTIRHEFGHVLGLPDCYHEFYDENLKAYVNYQLDVTDLMCSRAGNMKERIYAELKKTYAQ